MRGFSRVILPFSITLLLLAFSRFNAAPENSSVEIFRDCSVSDLLFYLFFFFFAASAAEAAAISSIFFTMRSIFL